METEQITRSECRELLRHARLGRVIYTADAMPAVTVVPYEIVDNAIVFAASDDLRIAPKGRRDVIAFEIDDCDNDDGWSVVVVGRACEMRDRASRSIRLDCTIINGVRWATSSSNVPVSQDLRPCVVV